MKYPHYCNSEKDFTFHLLNKKVAIHEFIKDIESNTVFHNSNKQTLIRNISIPQLF